MMKLRYEIQNDGSYSCPSVDLPEVDDLVSGTL